MFKERGRAEPADRLQRERKKIGEREVEDCEAIGTGRDRTGCFSGLTESLFAGQCVK